MNSNISNDRIPAGSKLWLICCLALLAVFFWLLPSARISSSIMALLPAKLVSDASPELAEGFIARLDKQLVWLVSTGDDSAPAAAQDWFESLEKQPFLAQPEGPVSDSQQQQWGAFFYQHRNALLDATTRNRLQQPQAQADWVISQLFSPFAGVSSAEISNDPLLLVRSAQLALQQQGSQFRMQNGWLVVTDDAGRDWYMIHAGLAGSSSDIRQIKTATTALDAQKNAWLNRHPGGQLLSRGSLYYSAYASQQAEADMTRLGTLTVGGVLLLIAFVFHSVRPVFLALLSVGTGALGGIVATLLVYGEIHLMTLVMSMSIIGISVDYAIYYLVERMVHGNQRSALGSMAKIRPALLLSLGTTASAYLIMMFAPFPGIQQLALFASVGLTCACLTVIHFFPLLTDRLPVRPLPFGKALSLWIGAWKKSAVLPAGLFLVAIGICVSGLSSLRVNDDIAALQALPEQLVQQDQRIGQLTGQSSEQSWFLIAADNQELALQRLEAFLPTLEQARQAGLFQNYQALPFYSQARQKENAALVRQAADIVEKRFRETGLGTIKIDPSEMNVAFPDWLDSPASRGWKLMVLTLDSGKTGILVPVSKIRDQAAVAALADPAQGVQWVARKAQFNQLFGHYRQMLAGLLVLALGLIAVIYMLRFGFRAGLVCTVPTLLSLLVALGTLGLTGMPLNLFSLLALVLVIGIGINYSIFFGNAPGSETTSLLAITVALVTTLLTLGILVFSSTAAITGFGVVLCAGIFSAWLFSPLVAVYQRID